MPEEETTGDPELIYRLEFIYVLALCQKLQKGLVVRSVLHKEEQIVLVGVGILENAGQYDTVVFNTGKNLQ